MAESKAEPKKIAMIGSGNWGCAIARIIGATVQTFPNDFDQTIKMWVFEEKINVHGEERLLSDCVNRDHENYKYLPGYKLPQNVIGVTSLKETVKDADILLFVVPHQFIHDACAQIKGHVKTTAMGVSLIKGLSSDHTDEIRLISEEINDILGVQVSVLMGANLAREVAAGNFCEATIGTTDLKWGKILKKLFHSPNFRVNVVQDAHTVELCGALKNIVAMAAGFCDGLGCGDNTKAAVIRLGLMEILQFVEIFYKNSGFKLSTFFESCGIADLVTTCYGGRNRKCSEAFVKTRRELKDLETEILQGQRLQGPHTAAQVFRMLQKKSQKGTDLLKEFPLFVAVHKICEKEMQPEDMIDCLRRHPSHIAKMDGDAVDI